MTHAEFVESLRALADFYEAHPTLPPAYSMSGTDISIFAQGKEELAGISEVFYPKAEIKSCETFFRLFYTEKLGAFTLQALDYHSQVCERKVVGHRTVKKQVATGYTEVEEREEVVEWHCPEIAVPSLPAPKLQLQGASTAKP
jgi:hypothetical protein